MPRSNFFSILRERLLSRGWHLLLLSMGCTLVISLLVSSYWQITASLQAQGTLRAQAERLERLDSMSIQITDAESSVRGYLLSHNRAYLKPYESNKESINATLEEIRQDLSRRPENDELIADLSGLISLKMKILAQAVQLGRAGEEVAPGKSASGMHYMDRIRDTLAVAKLREITDGELAIEESIANVYKTRWVVTILSGGALLLLLALYFLLNHQLALREQISELLHNENQRLESLVQERTDELSQLASHLTNAREVEQASLARELHDELGALMTAAKMDASAIIRDLDAETLAPLQERFDRLLDTLDSGIALKRQLIDGLRPPLLRELGLVAALEALCEDFARGSEIHLQLDLPHKPLTLKPDLALALFRIAQEGLTNIRKYAEAGKVTLSLGITEGKHILLTLEDDGIGFDTAKVSRHRHGLAGMKHRVQMFSGEFALSSRPAQGTRISAGIPLV